MDAADALALLGGAGHTGDVVRLCGRRALQRALADGTVVRVARGRYVLADSDRTTRVVTVAGGVRSGLVAAQAHGWGVLRGERVIEVAVPLGRAVRPQPGVRLHRVDVTPGERSRGRTDPVRTVLRCAATLPFVEALVVADSALRSGDVRPEELADSAQAFTGHGVREVGRVVRWTDPRSANAFESALRGHLIAAGVTSFVPQHVVTGPGFLAVVDLADPRRRVALEADGFTVHGTRQQLARDLRRHDELAALGWVTLRFAWEHVMGEPAWVVDRVRQVLRRRHRRPEGIRAGPPQRRRAA